jgi:RNA polymerase sigma factor (sigma-70 family)
MNAKRKATRDADRNLSPCRHLEPEFQSLVEIFVSGHDLRLPELQTSVRPVTVGMYSIAATHFWRWRFPNVEDHANDVVQEWWARMLAKGFAAYAHFGRGRPFYPYADCILRNLCRDIARQTGRHPCSTLDFGVYDRQEDPVGAAERNEVALDVRGALQRLSPHLKSAVILRYWDDLPAKEAAIREKTTVRAINMRVFKGRRLLRQMLSERGVS